MGQLTPIKGFVNTPVTRSICLLTTVLALSISIYQVKHYVRLALDPFLIRHSQYWRVAAFQFAVVNESDYFLVVLLWFHFKTLERFYGLRKYLLLITVFALYNALVTVIVSSVGQLAVNLGYYLANSLVYGHGSPNSFRYHDTVFNAVALGPFGLLSLLYVCYGFYVPVSYHFRVLLTKSGGAAPARELTLTSHFYIHVVYTLFLLNNLFESILPCAVGLLLGKLHTQDILPGLRAWLMPAPVFRFFIHPLRFCADLAWSVQQGFGGHAVVAQTGAGPAAGPEDEDEMLDEREREERRIRAETPVRPLGSQFLDAFRPGS